MRATRAAPRAWRSRASRLRGCASSRSGWCAGGAASRRRRARRRALRQGARRAAGLRAPRADRRRSRCSSCWSCSTSSSWFRRIYERLSVEPGHRRRDRGAGARGGDAACSRRTNPARRLVDFDDATAQWLSSHLTWGGRLFGAFIVLRALHRTIGAPQVDRRCDADAVRRDHRRAAGASADRPARDRRGGSVGAPHSGHAPARLDRGRRHRRRAARRLCELCVVPRRPRRVHRHADRDALSAADRHRRGDQPHAVGGLAGRPQARAPARHRAAPARPDRQADLRHRARAVRADRAGARGRPLGSRGRRPVRGGQGRRARHPHRRLHHLVRRGVRRHRVVPDRASC